MNTREEVWLRAWCAASFPGANSNLIASFADGALREFDARFPPDQPDQDLINAAYEHAAGIIEEAGSGDPVDAIKWITGKVAREIRELKR